MRIIGGKAARQTLRAPKGYAVRPTPDLVKQAIFNSLGSRVIDADILELFAGSGALGLECLSRGARSIVSVEKSERAAHLIRENLKTLELDPVRFELRVQDAFVAVTQLCTTERKFDLVFADPPYGEKNLGRRSTSFAQQLLDDDNLHRMLKHSGLLILGHTKRDTLSIPAEWKEKKVLKHGDSVIRFLRCNDESSATGF